MLGFRWTHTNLALTPTFPLWPYLLNFMTAPFAPTSWPILFLVLRFSQILHKHVSLVSIHAKKAPNMPFISIFFCYVGFFWLHELSHIILEAMGIQLIANIFKLCFKLITEFNHVHGVLVIENLTIVIFRHWVTRPFIIALSHSFLPL